MVRDKFASISVVRPANLGRACFLFGELERLLEMQMAWGSVKKDRDRKTS
jgi:hypothetical protein